LHSSFFLHHSSFPEGWGNLSSAYKFGSKLKGVSETARAQVAELIGAQPRETTFTPRGAWGTDDAIHTALTCLREIDIIA
jgi:cysteine desulfurase